jgi:hypothetical protein
LEKSRRWEEVEKLIETQERRGEAQDMSRRSIIQTKE